MEVVALEQLARQGKVGAADALWFRGPLVDLLIDLLGMQDGELARRVGAQVGGSSSASTLFRGIWVA